MVRVRGCPQRIGRIPVACIAEADAFLIDCLPAFLQPALFINADAEKQIRAAVASGTVGKPAGILHDPDLAIHVTFDQVQMTSAFVGGFTPCNRCGVIADGIARLFTEIFDKGFELFDFVAVALVNIMADADPERNRLPQVFNDPFKGGTTAAQMAGSVMCRADTIKRDLGAFHLRLLKAFQRPPESADSHC